MRDPSDWAGRTRSSGRLRLDDEERSAARSSGFRSRVHARATLLVVRVEPGLSCQRLNSVKQADVKLARSGLLAVAVGAVALVLAACESVTPAAVPRPSVTAPGSAHRPTGLITGMLGIYGGVLDRYSLPQAGTVRLIAADGHIDVSVGKSGQFSVRVPTGRYDVTAGLRHPMDWPMGTCSGLFGPDAYYDRNNRLNYIVVKKDEHLRIRVGCIAG